MASKEGKRLASVKGSREGKQLQVGPQICSSCDSGDLAVTYCQKCPDHLCDECTKSHKRLRRTKDHDLIDLKLSDSKRTCQLNPCPKHDDYHVEKICFTCKDIACEICVKELHMSHKVGEIIDCADKVFDTCLDKTKELQSPFTRMKKAKKEAERYRKGYADQCKNAENEINQRKTKVISLINKIADNSIDSVKSNKREVETVYKDAIIQLDSVLQNCETVATPLVMGTDISNIVKRILFIKDQISEANGVLATVDLLGNNSAVKLENEDYYTDIEENARKYLCVQSSSPPAFTKPNVKPHKPRLDPSTKKSTPAVSQPKSSSGTLATKPLSLKTSGIPNKVQLVNTSQTDTYYYFSKHINSKSFLVQREGNGSPKRMSFTSDAKVLDNPSTYGPTPRLGWSQNILTISDQKHIIISSDAIHLCDNNNVIHSAKHSSDGYIPASFGYIDEHKFVTVRGEQNKIRYYDTTSLQVLNTHSLSTTSSDELQIQGDSVLCTGDGDVLLQTGDRELSRFSSDGVMKGVVHIHGDYFECDRYTICIDRHDHIFGVQQKDGSGSIHVFNLQGGHNVVGNIEMYALWNTGIDDDNHLYVSYYTISGEDCIAKYKY